ncbi:unnamed protein product, partial [Ectocarpus fasciculatus]
RDLTGAQGQGGQGRRRVEQEAEVLCVPLGKNVLVQYTPSYGHSLISVRHVVPLLVKLANLSGRRPNSICRTAVLKQRQRVFSRHAIVKLFNHCQVCSVGIIV